MYRIEFYRWSELKQRYELVRTYWTAKGAVDELVSIEDIRSENEDRKVYRYNIYGIPGRSGFFYYSIDNNRFPSMDNPTENNRLI